MPAPYLLILAIPLTIYAALSVIIIFHLKRYGIAGDFTKQLTTGFLIVSAVLIFFITWAFFNVPWNELNLADILQNATGSFPGSSQPPTPPLY